MAAEEPSDLQTTFTHRDTSDQLVMEPVTPEEPSTAPAGDLAVVVTVPDLLVVQASEAATERLRADPNALPTSLSTSLVESDWDHVRTVIVPLLVSGETWSGRLQFRDPEGVERPLPALFVPHVPAHGDVERATLVIDAQRGDISWAGAIDHLTGLPTRPVLLDRLHQALTRVERRSTDLAVLFLDLDGLKLINDRYGHETGDEFLIDTAARLRACLRTGDTVARFGGDEFVILCEDLERRELAHQVAERILDSLLRTDGKAAIGASIGIAFASDAASTGAELVAQADAAMYRAKQRGGRRSEVFDTAMQQRQDEDASLRRRLMHAVANDELAVAAQPLFELQTGIVRGVELFVRFAGNSMEPIGATEVLRLAREQTEAIDTAVLVHAASLARVWRRALGSRAPRVHVNISPQSLSSPDLLPRLTSILDAQRLSSSALVLEVDGTTILHADERHVSALQTLATRGFGVAIDGLVSGQLPLGLIADIRPHIVKVDALTADPDLTIDAVMAMTARRLAPLGIAVSAKGLENQRSVSGAVASGIWAGQGQVLHAVGGVEQVNEALFSSSRIGF